MDFNFDTGSISSILELDPGTSALKISGTNGVVIPNGTTAERNAQTGIFRFNTDLGFFEGFDGVKWSSVQIDTGVSWNSGLYADIPAAGNQGAMYYATDTNTIYYDNGVSWQLESPAFSGDVTSTPGSTTLTLATVNSNTGTFGSSTAVPVLTVNEKGLITAITTDTISSAISLIGDASGSGTTGSDITLTLATVNANTGTFGSSSQVGSFTVNAKGLITAAENIAVTPEAIGAINTNQLGANNGVATLDSNGKLTSTQVPDVLVGALQYQGVWNATTNSPTLVSGTGTKGQYYKVSVATTPDDILGTLPPFATAPTDDAVTSTSVTEVTNPFAFTAI